MDKIVSTEFGAFIGRSVSAYISFGSNCQLLPTEISGTHTGPTSMSWVLSAAFTVKDVESSASWRLCTNHSFIKVVSNRMPTKSSVINSPKGDQFQSNDAQANSSLGGPRVCSYHAVLLIVSKRLYLCLLHQFMMHTLVTLITAAGCCMEGCWKVQFIRSHISRFTKSMSGKKSNYYRIFFHETQNPKIRYICVLPWLIWGAHLKMLGESALWHSRPEFAPITQRLKILICGRRWKGFGGTMNKKANLPEKHNVFLNAPAMKVHCDAIFVVQFLGLT